jgi:hypothetical protein
MPMAMHSLLAHLYHLAILPLWRAPAAAFLIALILRAMGRGKAAYAAGFAVLAGWLAVQYPVFSVLPAKPVDRLPGLAVILLGYIWLSPMAGKRTGFLMLPGFAVVAAWWIAGAPVAGPGIAGCVPVFLGVWAALALTRRLAAKDTGWAGIGAALALAGAIFLAGGSPHWARAALVPACAGLALVGVSEAALPLAFATILAGCLTVLASDRGRFVPVDLAVMAPLLVWFLAPRVLPRLNRAGPVLAAFVATLAGVGLVVGAIKLLALR